MTRDHGILPKNQARGLRKSTGAMLYTETIYDVGGVMKNEVEE